MHCSRVAVRLACSQTLLVRANPARPVSLVPSSSVTVRFASATSDREGKYLKKKKISEKRKGKDGEDIEEAPENALSVKDETEPATVFPQLRHQHKGPIPGFNDKNSITDNEQQQREVIRRQEQLRAQKQDILRKVKALDSVKLDAQTLQGQMMDVTFNSIEEAYAAFRGQLEIALYEKNPEKAYETIVNSRRMGLRFPKKDYDAAAILFAEEQHIYKVKDVWEYMQKDEIYPDQESFMNVFTIYCHMTQYEWALRTFFKMCEYICPDANAYQQGIELFAKNTHIGNLRKAEQLFHTVQRFDVKHNAETCGNFIKMLCASGYEGDADRAIDVLKYMKNKVIEPIPAEVPKYFVDHIKKFVIPERAYIRAKKVLRGCQHAGLPEEPFKALWTVVDSKAYVNKIERADLAAPLEKMDLTPKKQTPGLRYG